jgi:hypothetical protein
LDPFRALKPSDPNGVFCHPDINLIADQESFGTLIYLFRVLDVRVRTYSNLESFGALKLSILIVL